MQQHDQRPSDIDHDAVTEHDRSEGSLFDLALGGEESPRTGSDILGIRGWSTIGPVPSMDILDTNVYSMSHKY